MKTKEEIELEKEIIFKAGEKLTIQEIIDRSLNAGIKEGKAEAEKEINYLTKTHKTIQENINHLTLKLDKSIEFADEQYSEGLVRGLKEGKEIALAEVIKIIDKIEDTNSEGCRFIDIKLIKEYIKAKLQEMK